MKPRGVNTSSAWLSMLLAKLELIISMIRHGWSNEYEFFRACIWAILYLRKRIVLVPARGPWPRSKHNPIHKFRSARSKIIFQRYLASTVFFVCVLDQSTRFVYMYNSNRVLYLFRFVFKYILIFKINSGFKSFKRSADHRGR